MWSIKITPLLSPIEDREHLGGVEMRIGADHTMSEQGSKRGHLHSVALGCAPAIPPGRPPGTYIRNARTCPAAVIAPFKAPSSG